MAEPLWRPNDERVASANMTAFMRKLEADWQRELKDYAALHRFSIEEMEKFWLSLWDFCGVVAETRGNVVMENPERMPGCRFFPDARLNFAENLLRRSDDSDALVFRGEDKVRRRMSWRELHEAVSRLAQALERDGVGPGDRVAGWLPNLPETVIAMLAATSLGAVWSTSSPDFGVQGVVDRFGQIEPKVLFAADGYHYNGKAHDCLVRLKEIVERLPSVKRVVVVAYTREVPPLGGLPATTSWHEYLAPYRPQRIDYAQLPFNHPLYILFSSGTTGAPKCIVHSVGGTLLTHLKEHKLHGDIKPGDRLFWFTTCGWMMWNWLASGLAAEATLLLYDGSPFHPSGNVVFDFAQETGMSFLGTSAKFIDACRKAGLAPAKSHKLASCARSARPALRSLPRASITSMRRSRRTSIWPRSRAAPTSSAASSAAIPWGPSGAARSRPRCSAWRSRCSTKRAGRLRARRASSSASGPFPRCRSASGTTPATRNTAPPTSRNFPASGAMATGR